MEADELGVSVCVVQPGPYETEIWTTSVPRGERYLSATGLSAGFRCSLSRDGRAGQARRFGPSDEAGERAGRFVVDTAEARRAFLHLTSPGQPRVLRMLRSLLSTRRFHRLLLTAEKRSMARCRVAGVAPLFVGVELQ